MGEIGSSVKEGRTNGIQSQQDRCWDWMIVSGTSHYARDRSAFKTYRHVGKAVKNTIAPELDLFVAGIGTVELGVRTGDEEGSPDGVLVLENVLHVPNAICNGFSWVVYDGMHGGFTHIGLETRGFDRDGRPLWCGQPFVGLRKLVLAGNPQGVSNLRDGGHFMLSIYVTNDDLGIIQAAACESE
jgi:hypothetical protein